MYFMYATGFILFALQFNGKLLELIFVFFHLCHKIYQVLEASKMTSGNDLTLELIKIFLN